MRTIALKKGKEEGQCRGGVGRFSFIFDGLMTSLAAESRGIDVNVSSYLARFRFSA